MMLNPVKLCKRNEGRHVDRNYMYLMPDDLTEPDQSHTINPYWGGTPAKIGFLFWDFDTAIVDLIENDHPFG